MGHSVCHLPIDLEPLKSQQATERMRRLKIIGEGFADSDKIRVERALAGLLAGDPNPIVRHEAAFVLADLRRRDLIFGSVALSALWSSVHDQSVLVRHEVALSLAAFPCEVTTRCLDQLLRDQCEDVRLSATLALEEIAEREAR